MLNFYKIRDHRLNLYLTTFKPTFSDLNLQICIYSHWQYKDQFSINLALYSSQYISYVLKSFVNIVSLNLIWTGLKRFAKLEWFFRQVNLGLKPLLRLPLLPWQFSCSSFWPAAPSAIHHGLCDTFWLHFKMCNWYEILLKLDLCSCLILRTVSEGK